MSYSAIKEALSLTEPKIRVRDKSKATAYHESGHAIIMLLYGFVPESATIIPDGTRSGAVKGINNADMASEHLLVEYSIDASAESCFNYSLELSFAGMIAESFVTGEYNWEGFDIDAGSIFDEYVSAHGSHGKVTTIETKVLQSAWECTRTLILENFVIVREIAEELFKLKILDTGYFKWLSKSDVYGIKMPPGGT